MPDHTLTQKLLLPELTLANSQQKAPNHWVLNLHKNAPMEVCPKCASPSRAVYDRRWVHIKDTPLVGIKITLRICKRRFLCPSCRKPFTEPVPGIKKGCRTSQRYKAALLRACETYADLKQVRRDFNCSSGYLYQALYEMLALKRRMNPPSWPHSLGIDEHAFRRLKDQGRTQFVTMLVNHNKKRVMEMVLGKTGAELREALQDIPGRENVQYVVMDMCDAYRSFVKDFFPQAAIVADKFHVLRLLHPAINKYRKEITGDKRSLPIRKWLLRRGDRLKPTEKRLMRAWLKQYPDLEALYDYKEAMHRFYRTKGCKRAAETFTRLTDSMAKCPLPDIQRLRRTLMRWRKEILLYFKTKLTNARTEGFNNKAKVIKRRAYGYRSFRNYRLRVLNATA